MRPLHTLVASACSATALIALAGLSLTSAAPDASAAPAAAPTGLLARGTPVRVRLDTPLRAGQCKDGDPVAFTVAQDVFGPGGERLLAKGAAGVGHVMDSAGHHSFGQNGRLSFSCDSVTGGGGLRVPVSLSVRPIPPVQAAPTPEPAATPPLNDLHAPSTVYGDVFAGTPLTASGQVIRSASGNFTLGVGADPSADSGDEFEATVASDVTLSVLPAPPGPAIAPGAGVTLRKRADGVLILTMPPGSQTAATTR